MAKKGTAAKPEKIKKPRKVKVVAAKDEAPDGAAPKDHNEVKADPEKRELARHHRDRYLTLKKAVDAANNKMRSFEKEVKSDGLTMRTIKLMVELSTPEGETAWRMSIANDLIAAQYQGAAIGQQLALFLEPDRTPAVDIAYDEGVQDCMDGKAPKPEYDPSVPQHQSYLKGYGDEQDRRMAKGFKKLEPEETKARAETLAAARDKNAQQAESDKFH